MGAGRKKTENFADQFVGREVHGYHACHLKLQKQGVDYNGHASGRQAYLLHQDADFVAARFVDLECEKNGRTFGARREPIAELGH